MRKLPGRKIRKRNSEYNKKNVTTIGLRSGPNSVRRKHNEVDRIMSSLLWHLTNYDLKRKIRVLSIRVSIDQASFSILISLML